jgi:hypothetical protein
MDDLGNLESPLNLDPVEAERFISLLSREGSDYTEWRKSSWEDMSVHSGTIRCSR